MVPGLNASTAWTCGSLDNRVRKSVIGGRGEWLGMWEHPEATYEFVEGPSEIDLAVILAKKEDSNVTGHSLSTYDAAIFSALIVKRSRRIINFDAAILRKARGQVSLNELAMKGVECEMFSQETMVKAGSFNQDQARISACLL